MLRSRRTHALAALALLAIVVQLPWAVAFGQTRAAETAFAREAAQHARVGLAAGNEKLPHYTHPSSPCQQLDGTVVVRDARLSVHVADQSLAVLLGAVARCAPRLAIGVAPELEDDPVSIAFADVPVDEGLRWIVRAYDAFFYYAGAQASPVLGAVWVFRKGQGRALAPLDTTAWASDADVERRLTDPDPDTRLRGLKALIERRGAAAMDAVLTVLADGDEVVRAQALDLAFGGGLRIPPDQWSALALSDPSPLIRLQALQYAPEGPELASVAEAAQTDPDPYVQMEARAILARIADAAAAGSKGRPVPQP